MTVDSTVEVPTKDGVNFDDITGMLADQVIKAITEIHEANVTLLSSEGETGVRAIIAAFKEEGKVEDVESLKAWEAFQKADAKAKELREKALNLYRVNVLDEDEVSDEEVDKEALKEVRKTAMTALGLIKDFAGNNNLSDVIAWVDTVAVPQVGRQGSSTVSNIKKPRAFVTVGDATHNSFGEAAKALSASLSTEDKKVAVSATDLVQAWSDQGEGETFTFGDVTIKVALKAKEA